MALAQIDIPPFFLNHFVETDVCLCDLDSCFSPCKECKELLGSREILGFARSTTLFDPFREDEPLDNMPLWKEDLDKELGLVFKPAFLACCSAEETASRILRISGDLSKENMRILIAEIFLHWSRFQFRIPNSNEFAMKIAIILERLATGIGFHQPIARLGFQDELSSLCVNRFQLAWHRLVYNAIDPQASRSRRRLFFSAMSILTMISHLFRVHIVPQQTALNLLEFLSEFMPKRDAVIITYAFLLQLGFRIYSDDGIGIIQDLVRRLDENLRNRPPYDPIHQLAYPLKTIVNEWHQTRFALNRVGSQR
ncbi:hypothetical protein BJ138DRAFT_1148813 [Hygrophoropsis aurantiaca]|uniref:Uncharacterized protein n=1 Tax=Hygrophoropsis aurantiaca TaxID=72124 RepID=A0ACB8AFT9_9AGAM|nr:hypothetical protein BJ138DRAFT_1148813 [Hygrophoropsis aurantiaca]